MRRVVAFVKNLSSEEAEAVCAVAGRTAFGDAQIVRADTFGEPDPQAEDEIALVLGTAATCADPSLDDDLAVAIRGGRRVIWVWPAGTTADTALPSGAAKYCFSIIPWDEEKLSEVANDDGAPRFEDPGGLPLPEPETERNMCVDEKKALKKAGAE